MRTAEQIIEYYEKMKNEDFLGVIASDLFIHLQFEDVKPYLNEIATKESWEYIEPTEKYLKSAIISYLPFAFQKANNQRGISASRSIQHFQTWLWLLEDQELFDFVSDSYNYEPYGLPMLNKIQEKYKK